MQSLPKVTLISHTYLEPSYRGKLSYLGGPIPLTLISPSRFPWSYALPPVNFEPANYGVQTYAPQFPVGVTSSTRWTLRSRDLGFRSAPPSILHVENDVHSFILMQALLYRRLYAPHAHVVVFVWANQPLTGLKATVLNPVASTLSAPRLISTSPGISQRKTYSNKMVFPHIGLPSSHKPALPYRQAPSMFKPRRGCVRNWASPRMNSSSATSGGWSRKKASATSCRHFVIFRHPITMYACSCLEMAF